MAKITSLASHDGIRKEIDIVMIGLLVSSKSLNAQMLAKGAGHKA